jgi:hypothetical protein
MVLTGSEEFVSRVTSLRGEMALISTLSSLAIGEVWDVAEDLRI